MIITTTPDVPNREISETIGVVSGNVIQSKHIGRDIMAGLKSLVGGEITGYTELMNDARMLANHRIQSEAAELGADAIVNLRYTTSMVMPMACELYVYGTAVKLK